MDKPSKREIAIAPDDYEDVDINDLDNPEWTNEDFTRARPLREVLPELHRELKDGVAVVSPTPERKAS